LGDALDQRGIGWTSVRLYEGETLPKPGSVSGVAVLGGAMGAYDESAYPYLVEEKRFLAACTRSRVPVLGICLGCQLLADALGGRAYLADAGEVVFAPVELTADGKNDPVVARLAGRRVIRFHQDTFDLPPDATLLATGGGFSHAFRVGTAVGIQPHPEVTSALLAGWLADGDGRRLAINSGTDPDVLVGTFSAAEAEVQETAAAVFDAWIDEITENVHPGSETPRRRGEPTE
jgi:GMP synthase (glutamine-hydrolysing)